MFSKKELDQFGEDVDNLIDFVREYEKGHPSEYQDKFIFFWKDHKELQEYKDTYKKFIDVITGDMAVLHRYLTRLFKHEDEKKSAERVLHFIPIVKKEVQIILDQKVFKETDEDYKLCKKIQKELDDFKSSISKPGSSLEM